MRIGRRLERQWGAMSMEAYIKSLGLDKHIQLDEVPKIDLYMDQVIQLFETKYKETVRNDKEKVLTKTMVNNYGKDKLFFPIEKKKYTQNHILLIDMIYHLKGALSIPDIKLTLSEANDRIVQDDLDFQGVYQTYLQICEKQLVQFEEEVRQKTVLVQTEASKVSGDDTYTQRLLAILSFVEMSNIYRKLAEKMIDEL